MSKLKFQVIHYTSEDNGYPADELNMHSPNTKGWQSVKFSEYPQELGFELIGGNEFKLSQVQILSHQSKIAKKIGILHYMHMLIYTHTHPIHIHINIY